MAARRAVFIASLLCTAAVGQWSTPVTLATGLQHYGAGPLLVPHSGDSIWVFWMAQTMPPWLLGRCYHAETWYEAESVAQCSEGLAWPAGVVDDSGRVLVAWYKGSYPVAPGANQDSWGIYSAVRTNSGWTRPLVCQLLAAQSFPANIRLTRSQSGSVGMAWDESSGGMSALESLMFSRKTSGGWTPRRCLLPGLYPDRPCICGGLTSGDSTDFCVTFTRWSNADSSSVIVWDLADSLVHSPAGFAGASPAMARGQDESYLVFDIGDSVMGSVNEGQGWSIPALVADNSGWGGSSLCTDPLGWGWCCWPDSQHKSVFASYNRGSGWSLPETVVTAGALGSPEIRSDASGNLHCVWFDHTGGGSGQLKHARRLTRPGVEERPSSEVRRTNCGPTVVRGVLLLPVASGAKREARGVLLDATGRTVLELHAGANDMGHLAPGIYLVRETSSGERVAVDVRKVTLNK